MNIASSLPCPKHPIQTLQPTIYPNCLLASTPIASPHSLASLSCLLLTDTSCLPPNVYPSGPSTCNTLLPNSYVAFMAQLKMPCIPQNLFWFFQLEAASLVSGPQ